MAKSQRVARQSRSAVPKAVVIAGGMGVTLLGLGGYFALPSETGSTTPNVQTAAVDVEPAVDVGATPTQDVLSRSKAPAPSGPVAVETVAAETAARAETAPPQPIGADADLGASEQVTPVKVVQQSDAQAVSGPDCVDELTKMAEVFRVNFDVGATVFDPSDREFIRVFGAAISGCSEAAVIVGGHSDPSGDAGINLQLSWQRADSVVDVWREFGFETDRVEPIGFGSRQPLTEGDTSDDEINRRVEFKVTRISGKGN